MLTNKTLVAQLNLVKNAARNEHNPQNALLAVQRLNNYTDTDIESFSAQVYEKVKEFAGLNDAPEFTGGVFEFLGDTALGYACFAVREAGTIGGPNWNRRYLVTATNIGAYPAHTWNVKSVADTTDL